MLPQEKMIARLRHVCQQDQRLVAAMLYGSFPRAEADKFSDLDCAFFFADARLPEIDPQAWVGQIAPVELFYSNEFGNRVAIFANLVRGEFHFDPASAMPQIESWRGKAWFPSPEAAVLVDRTGQLARHLQALSGPPVHRDTPQEVRFLCASFLNWMLFGANVLARGERARALEILQLVQDYVLRMARLVEGSTAHWVTPTKNLERELSPAAYARYAACTAHVQGRALEAAYRAAWRWGNELLAAIAPPHGLALPEALIGKLERRFSTVHF